MSLTAPYSPDAEINIRKSVRHVYSVTAYPVTGEPFALDVKNIKVAFDATWSTYIQATIECAIPNDQAKLDALDPRRGCRLKITLGYVYDGGIRDEHQVADLHLRSRPLTRPQDTITVVAHSDETRVFDFLNYWINAPAVKSGVNEAVAWLVGKALPGSPVIQSSFPAKYGASLLTDLETPIGNTAFSILDEIGSRVGARIHCPDGITWRIEPLLQVVGVSAHKLFTGPDGTIIASQADIDREAWSNAVVLEYKWTDANNTERTIYGSAAEVGGEFGIDVVGNKTYYEQKEGAISQFQADQVARNYLSVFIERARTISLTAVAAYWLRPGMTVTVQLPIGDQERLIVTSVTFDPSIGTMEIQARKPEPKIKGA